MTTLDPEVYGSDERLASLSDAKVRFKRLKDYKPGEAWLLLLYGQSKVGKSYFAGTAGSRTLYLNVGDGIDTLLMPSFTNKYGKIADDMIVVDIREDRPGSPAEAFELTIRALKKAFEELRDEFDTVVLDEATSFRRYAVNKAMEINTAVRTTGKRGSSIETFVAPEIGDYGTEMKMIEWFLNHALPIFKEEKKNFLMLAHERQIFGKPPKIGEDAPLKKVMPGFTGKTFPDQVPKYFDDVWRMEAVGGGNNIVYRIRTAGTEKEVGGSRHGGIFNTVEPDPNYLSMLSRIRNRSNK